MQETERAAEDSFIVLSDNLAVIIWIVRYKWVNVKINEQIISLCS